MSLLRAISGSNILAKCRTNLINQPVRTLKQTVEEKLGLPKKPKKPSTTFIKFLSKQRPELLRKNPNASAIEITRIGSELWKNVDEATRALLKNEYKKEAEAYSKEMSKYDSRLTLKQKEEITEALEEIKEERDKKEAKRALNKRMKELERPVKPMSSYLIFCKAEQKNRGNKTMNEFQVEISEKWRKLPEDLKNKYSREAEKSKKTYDDAMDAWEQKMMKDGNLDVVRQKTLSDGKSKK